MYLMQAHFNSFLISDIFLPPYLMSLLPASAERMPLTLIAHCVQLIICPSKFDQFIRLVNNPLNKQMHYFESELKTGISCIQMHCENGVWSLAHGSGDGTSYIGTFKENLHMPGKFKITKLMVFRDQFMETAFLNGKA